MAGVDVDTLTMEQYLALSKSEAMSISKSRVNSCSIVGRILLRNIRTRLLHDHIDLICKRVGAQTRPKNYQYLGSPQKGLYPKGPIPRMRPAQALTAIQTMADHSQKMARREQRAVNIGGSSSKDGTSYFSK
ncbi:hypothetical protein Tco_0860432 [Tanacetum coccineum]|uniref:Uncharacterized protein n=1 Tax=Tanacetum coccineum TaxID=301880 RepID=A0ABQ5BEY2_9ASTR